MESSGGKEKQLEDLFFGNDDDLNGSAAISRQEGFGTST